MDRLGWLNDGTMVTVEATVVDTLRRLREGDPTLGWEGDQNMQLMADLSHGVPGHRCHLQATVQGCPGHPLYDVWTLDVRGEAMLVVGDRPYSDQRLIVDVLHADERRFPLADRLAEREKAKAAQERTAREERAEQYDKLHWALMRDVGHLEGGTRHRNLLHQPRVVKPHKARNRARKAS